MSQRLSCHCGHCWDAPQLSDAATSCPACGSALPATMPMPPPLPGAPPLLPSGSDAMTTLAPPAASLPTPTFTPPASTDARSPAGYEILEELGRGGMGVVYKARQTRLNRTVALKMILHGAHAGEQDLARFRVEAEAVARLQHPGIVQVFEAGEHDGKPFLALEHVDGGSLASKLQGRPWPAQRAAELIVELAGAIRHAHDHGIIHRDLKPANVLLTRTGAAKITDFGLAKRLDVAQELSRSGHILGTPQYMAPEQAEGKVKATGPAADVYALGAILYELLTSGPPFKGAGVEVTLVQVLHTDPVPPSRLAGGVPRDLETICLKCLNKEPARRYVTAGALADDLGRFLRGEPIVARPVGALARGWRWCRRNPAVAGLLAAVAVLLMAGTIIASSLAVIASRRADDAARAQGEAHRKAEDEADARRTAEKEKERADRKAEEEAQARGLAEKHLRESESLAYFGQVGMAAQAWRENNAGLARQLLDECRSDVRGWEHGYLRALFDSNQRLLTGHFTQVRAGAFSPTGRYLATAEVEWVKVWDLTTGLAAMTFRAPGSVPNEIAFSGDGLHLSVAGDDEHVFVWNLVQRHVEAKLELPKNTGAVRVTVNEDGQFVVVLDKKGELHAWNLRDKNKPVTPPESLHVTGIAFPLKGTQLTCVNEGANLTRWNLADGKSTTGKDLGEPIALITSDARFVVTQNLGGFLTVRNADTNAFIGTFKEELQVVRITDFSTDGKFCAGSIVDGRVVVRDIVTGEYVRFYQGHRRTLIHGVLVLISPDRRMLASFGDDAVVRLWDISVVQGERRLAKNQEGHRLAFAPDGTYLAAAAPADIVLLDAVSGKETGRLQGHTAAVNDLAFRPDGKLLLSASEDHSVNVWDVRERRSLRKYADHGAPVQAVSLTHNGALAASVGGDNRVRIWEAETGRTKTTFPGRSQVRFTPNDAYVATVLDTNEIALCDPENGHVVRRFKDALPTVKGMVFSPQGDRLAAFSQGRSISEVCVWDVESGAALWKSTRPPVNGVAFTRDGRRLVLGHSVEESRGDQEEVRLRVLDVENGHEVLTLRGDFGDGRSVVFSPDGRTLAVGCGDASIRLWEAAPHSPLTVRRAGQHPADLVFRDDSKLTVAGLRGQRGRPLLWDATTGQEIVSFNAPDALYTSLHLAPGGGRMFATLAVPEGTDPDGKPRQRMREGAWDPKSGKSIVLRDGGGTEWPTAVALRSDGKEAAVARAGRNIVVWDADRGEQRRRLEAGIGKVVDLAYSPNGRRLASAAYDPEKLSTLGEVKLWDVESGGNGPTLANPPATVLRVTFSPDGKLLAGGAVDGSLVLWDADSGDIVRTWRSRHFHAGVTAMAFSPDGKRLASAGMDLLIQLTDVTGDAASPAMQGHTGQIIRLAFSPDGKRLASLGTDEAVKIWDIKP
jgi:WD40 repeat protein/tRNA A-37 threonylcarbamoyl transferase component Bud32